MVLADSHEIPRASRYSGTSLNEDTHVSPTGLSPTTVTHPRVFGYAHVLSLRTLAAAQVKERPTTPHTHPSAEVNTHAHGLASSPFAHHYSGNAGTEMFHFPALPSTTLYIQMATTPHNECRVTPFGNPRINARLPTPRGISQAPTSFIGSRCQGIHRVP